MTTPAVATADAVITFDAQGELAYANDAGRALAAESRVAHAMSLVVAEARAAGFSTLRLPALDERPALQLACYAAGDGVTVVATPAARPAAGAGIRDSSSEVVRGGERAWGGGEG